MLDINKPVQTRDGQPARILCTDKKGNLPILALFGEDDRVGPSGHGLAASSE